MSVATVAAAFTTAFSAIKSGVELYKDNKDELASLIETLQVLWNKYVNGEEITAEELTALQAKVDALYLANMKVDKEKFGIEDEATAAATEEATEEATA